MLQLLISSKNRRGLSLDKTVMIGRQNIHMSKEQIIESLAKFNIDQGDIKKIYPEKNCYAEHLLEHLGALSVDSVDASDYEQASIIHDMNDAMDNTYSNAYDLVLDSGTLEHVFNFPVAVKNCMKITKPGGHFIGIYPANNFFGHGFYQFSSELFYRTFSEENGFEMIDVILFVDEKNATFYSVPDTSEKFHRINYTNSKPVLIYVLAKKLADVPLLQTNPLQMDYSQIKWQHKEVTKIATRKKPSQVKVPQYIKNLAKALLNKKPLEDSVNFNKPFFTKYQL